MLWSFFTVTGKSNIVSQVLIICIWIRRTIFTFTLPYYWNCFDCHNDPFHRNDMCNMTKKPKLVWYSFLDLSLSLSLSLWHTLSQSLLRLWFLSSSLSIPLEVVISDKLKNQKKRRTEAQIWEDRILSLPTQRNILTHLHTHTHTHTVSLSLSCSLQ